MTLIRHAQDAYMYVYLHTCTCDIPEGMSTTPDHGVHVYSTNSVAPLI